MFSTLRERWNSKTKSLGKALKAEYWFPHWIMAVLFILGGIWLFQTDLGDKWLPYLEGLFTGQIELSPKNLPPLVLGGGMILMSFGLIWHSRVAWSMSLFLASLALISIIWADRSIWQLVYFVFLITSLSLFRQSFYKSSVAANSLFALTSMVMLLLYSIIGSYYLGKEFDPYIDDWVTAFYYSIVTMTTVGYGDINPVTTEAKLFTISVIILGVAVFATSLTAVIAPMVRSSLAKIMVHKGNSMKRDNHYIVIGNNSLAINTCKELKDRGNHVTRIVQPHIDKDTVSGDDVVFGEPSEIDILEECGLKNAKGVISLLDDDSENAFVILAVKEVSHDVKTVTAVNDTHNLKRVKLVQPDIVIAPQILGGELVAMHLEGEEVSSDFLMKRLFQH
ncbi:ion channel [Kangiella marina]|uniref:Voltage-gated potassium channel protein n=1 Tax=Kangiella marina TaxID=1079178 RepID=A0ABP8IFL7_9GAMM